jgi:hypothetical protein
MANTLYISHAHISCNAGFVKQVFEDILGDIIDHVDEVTRKHDKGYDFKRFYIHFKASNSKLENTLSRIDKEEFVNITNGQVDRRTGEKRFWKVSLYIKKDKPVAAKPYMMSAEESAATRARKHNEN